LLHRLTVVPPSKHQSLSTDISASTSLFSYISTTVSCYENGTESVPRAHDEYHFSRLYLYFHTMYINMFL